MFALWNVPPDQETQNSRHKPVVNQVDAVMHLGAAGAGEGLADREEFLVLYIMHRSVIERPVTGPYPPSCWPCCGLL